MVASVFAVFGAVLIGVVGVIWFWRRRRRRAPKPPADWQRDVLYVHMFPRCQTKQVVNLSPFAMKIETWLRMNSIKYEVVETNQFSPRRKQIPYIWFNGQWFEDSGVILKHLTSHFKLDEMEGLTDEERAVSLSFMRMIEGHTAWTIFHYRYITNTEAFSRVFRINGNRIIRFLFPRLFKRLLKMTYWGQGIGRYTNDERAELGRLDVTAISNFLGDKPYLMGAKMTNLDCSAFGHLCQVVLVDMPYPHKAALEGKGQNLVQYIHRIKDKLWPDWEELCDVNGRFQ